MVHIGDTGVAIGLVGICVRDVDIRGGNTWFFDYVLIAITYLLIKYGYILTTRLTFTNSRIGESESLRSKFSLRVEGEATDWV